MKSAAVAGRCAGSLAMPMARTRSTRGGSPVAAALADGTLVLDMRARLSGGMVGGEGPAAGEQLEGDDGQRVAVAGVGRGVAARLLGRDVGRGAEDLPGLGQRGLGRHRGDAEVADRQAAALVDEQVGGLDVAVDDVGACAQSSASAASRSQRRARARGMSRPLRRRSATVPPEKCSMTMNGRPSCSPMS